MSDRATLIREQLTTALSPSALEIIDDSHRHAGHAGAKGGGHFNVVITAEAFIGKSLIERHRMVYAAMGELLASEVHALSIQANTPDESQS